ncbi:MAG: BON domain-containing protein, partial [Planctomycetota bacterium]
TTGVGSSGMGSTLSRTGGIGTSVLGGNYGTIRSRTPSSSSLFGSSNQLRGGSTRQQVGVTQQSVQNTMAALGQTTTTNTQAVRSTQTNTNRAATQTNRFTQTNRGRTTGSVGDFRARLRVGFVASPRALIQPGPALTARLEACARIQKRSPVGVSIEGGTAILQGVVATKYDRALAAQLARLEPGVRAVDNRLTLAPPPAPEAEEPASP